MIHRCPTSGASSLFRPHVLVIIPLHRCHSGELPFTFGTLGQGSQAFRDEFDYPFEQVTVDVWTAFARTHNPNPDPALLALRGYTTTAAALKAWGPWRDVQSAEPVRLINWPSKGSDWLETKQCDLLGFPLNFFED